MFKSIYFYFYPLKLFTVILSIYVLGLSFVTCNDEFPHEVPLNDDISQVSKNSDHSNEEEGDHCSPFCSCQCCQVNLDVHNMDTFDMSVPRISTEVFSLSYNVVQEFTYSIFQPPRI